MKLKSETAVLGGGCFWCIEAVYKRLPGVKSVVSGYAGGEKSNPTYENVSSSDTGHAEVVKIEFDPNKISYKELLDIFWKAHDPTTKDRQGADVGSQYRSIILYTNEEQKEAAEESIKTLENSNSYKDPIVTEIKPLQKFYPAEGYHQNFYDNNKNHPYCRLVIDPKLEKIAN